MAVATYNNIFVKKYNKISNYKDQEIEIENIWRYKSTSVPVIV